MQWLNSHAKRKRLVNEQGTGKVIEWPIIINIKKNKNMQNSFWVYCNFKQTKSTDMWYTCTPGSFIMSSAMLLKRMRVRQAVKKGYNILNCRMTYAVVKVISIHGQCISDDHQATMSYRLTLTTTLFATSSHTFCFVPKMWYESMEVSHKHG